MSSIDSENVEERIEYLFFERLVPLSHQMKNDGVVFFPLGFEDDRSSYFESRANRTMSGEDFEISASLAGVGLAELLRKQWSSPADAGLSQLADEMAALSQSLAESETEDEEVSPFIYVMF